MSLNHVTPISVPVATPHSAFHSEVKSEIAQSCLTLCNPVDCSPSGSSIHGILQARILEWVAISFSRGSSQPRDPTRSSALQADALISEPLGNTQNLLFLPSLDDVFDYIQGPQR